MTQTEPVGVTPSVDYERRFGGLARLYGVAGAERIKSAHVAVVGVGGVGSWAVEALARSGVMSLTLIDLDHVSESNINRQVHAVDATLGQAKVLAMRERIAHINPDCVVSCLEEFVDADNWPSLLPDGVDAVIDACDQVRAKTAMAAWARKTGVIFIAVGAAGGKRQAHWVDIADLNAVTHDPLLAQLRNHLRKSHGAPREGKRIGVACVYSKEAVAQPLASPAVRTGTDPSSSGQQSNDATPDATLNCHGYGSVVSVTASFGQCAAGWVLDKISSLASDSQ